MVWTLALALHFLQEDPAAAPPAAANGSALAEMIHNSGPVAFTVLVLLLIASRIAFLWLSVAGWANDRFYQPIATALEKAGLLPFVREQYGV